MKHTAFPPGWDKERVARVLKHYDSQTEEEAVAEDEAASFTDFDHLSAKGAETFTARVAERLR